MKTSVPRSRGRVAGLACALAAGLAVAPPPVVACNVPVFRYALERWPPEPYECILFHRGALAGADRAAADALEVGPGPAGPAPNVSLDRVDLAQPLPERWQALWEAQKGPGLPWLVVRYPSGDGGEGPVLWSGPLTTAAVASLTVSPARREIARRIVKGDSAVWVLLACGDKAKDDAAEAMLGGQLRVLEKSLELPDPDVADPDDPVPVTLRSPAPLKLAFSVLRVLRGDAAERLFIDMLLRSAGAQAPPADQPVVFPVFGRGRILGAIAGTELGPDSVREAASFLSGPCSCRIKELNPGMDMLVEANWDAVFEEPGAGREAKVPNLAAAGPALQSAAASPGTAPPAPPEKAGAAAVAAPAAASGGGHMPGLLAVALALAVGIGVVAVVVATVTLRRRPPG
jgi:hypothetical protein